MLLLVLLLLFICPSLFVSCVSVSLHLCIVCTKWTWTRGNALALCLGGRHSFDQGSHLVVLASWMSGCELSLPSPASLPFSIYPFVRAPAPNRTENACQRIIHLHLFGAFLCWGVFLNLCGAWILCVDTHMLCECTRGGRFVRPPSCSLSALSVLQCSNYDLYRARRLYTIHTRTQNRSWRIASPGGYMKNNVRRAS